ncbi:MAG: YchJ family metal-binding protein [Myxococcota bacterium]
MRARYTAFATGNVDFLIDTTHPEGPQAQPDRAHWRAELIEYCRATQFDGLTVLEHDVDDDAGRATVTFRAELSRDGQPLGFTERSLFLRVENRWLYHSGDMLSSG